MNQAIADDVKPREIWAWAMYDFANSGYTTVVVTAVFSAYFVAVVAGNAPWATFAWTAELAAASAMVILTAPFVGAYADARAAKKNLLLLTTVGCVLCTAGLAFAGPGGLVIATIFIILSSYFYGSGENLIAAFLPELASSQQLGKVSGWGWSLGYLGGLTVLALCLAYITVAQGRGESAAQFVPVTMLITAGMFALASVPTFLLLRERAQPQPIAAGSLWSLAFARVRHTLRHSRDYVDMRRLMICIVFYQAGISAVISLAAIYAQQAMQFTAQDTIILIFAVNITAAIGAFAFGYLQDRLGHVKTIAITLIGWLIMIGLAFVAKGPALFWVAANLAGICLGSSQSAGRALVGILSPIARRAEFYGLWGLAVKLSSILGPMTYGLVTWLTDGNHRLAMLVTGVYFLIGLAILAGIDVERGRRAALAHDAQEQDSRLPNRARAPFPL